MTNFKEFYKNFILLESLKVTEGNRKRFNDAYDVNFNDNILQNIFDRFTQRQNALPNKDVFGYDSLDDLKKALMPSNKEIKSVSNTRESMKVDGGVAYLLRTDDKGRTEKLYNLLQHVYGYDLKAEDLVDIVAGYNDMFRSKGAKNNIFDYGSIENLKNEIDQFRNNSVTRVDTDPDEGGSKKLYSDETVMVYKVNNYDDSKRFCHDSGKKASWCVAYQKDSQYWKTYAEEGKEFIFVMMRDGEKYAITINGKGKGKGGILGMMRGFIKGKSKGKGSEIEIYNTADQMVSGYHLVKKYPQIVKPIKNAGYTGFKSANQYDVTTTPEGWTEINEIYTGEIGSGKRIEVTSRIDETGEYLDAKKHGTWGMKTVSDNMTEYIWYLNGYPFKYTFDPDGEIPTKKFLSNNIHIDYTYYENEDIKTEIYYKNGEPHRDGDKPTYISYYKNGGIETEYYYKNGVKHRDGDKPTFIRYDKNGGVKSEYYYKNGVKHRDGDKPAHITSNDIIFYKNGKQHRDGDKPASILYNEDGEVEVVYYYKNGVEYKKKYIGTEYKRIFADRIGR